MTAKELGQQPAFPAIAWEGGDIKGIADKPGLTLRQHIAVEAMKGMLANPQTSAIVTLSKGENTDAYTYAALAACRMADALLEQLAKEQP